MGYCHSHGREYPPAYWPLGRVESVQSDKSGVVRVVTVQIETTTYVRPVHKLIYLPVDEETFQAYHSYCSRLSDS